MALYINRCCWHDFRMITSIDRTSGFPPFILLDYAGTGFFVHRRSPRNDCLPVVIRKNESRTNAGRQAMAVNSFPPSIYKRAPAERKCNLPELQDLAQQQQQQQRELPDLLHTITCVKHQDKQRVGVRVVPIQWPLLRKNPTTRMYFKFELESWSSSPTRRNRQLNHPIL